MHFEWILGESTLIIIMGFKYRKCVRKMNVPMSEDCETRTPLAINLFSALQNFFSNKFRGISLAFVMVKHPLERMLLPLWKANKCGGLAGLLLYTFFVVVAGISTAAQRKNDEGNV